MIRGMRVGLASLSLAGLMLLTVPASAAGSNTSVMARATLAAPVVSLPHTTIKGSPAVYSPAKLTATPRWNGTASCTTSNESFTITNGTSVTQEVTNSGEDLGSLPAEDEAGICINTDQAGKTDKFGTWIQGIRAPGLSEQQAAAAMRRCHETPKEIHRGRAS